MMMISASDDEMMIPITEDKEPLRLRGDDEVESPQTKVPFARTRLRRARKTVRLEPPMSPSMEASSSPLTRHIMEYIKEMLKKFGLEDSKPMKTPMSSDTKLTKDEECESVDSTKYRDMIEETNALGIFTTEAEHGKLRKGLCNSNWRKQALIAHDVRLETFPS
ncbi:hypothetical protein Tco_0168835 [Tanacetum coccineum]